MFNYNFICDNINGIGILENRSAAVVVDLVLQSNTVYTVASEEPIAGGVAISGDKILAVGTMEELAPYMGDATEVRNMGNQMIMPGLIDAHTHIYGQAPKVDLQGAASIEECIKRTQDFYAKHPETTVIQGRGWYASLWGGQLPTKAELDAVFPDIPVILRDLDGHQQWVNTAFLKLTKINKDTKAQIEAKWPGTIDVNTNGDPNGILHDGIGYNYCEQYLPEESSLKEITPVFETWAKYGVTSVNECGFWNSKSNTLKTLKSMEDNGTLTARVFTSFGAQKATDKDIKKGKSMYNSDMLHLNALKCLSDGVAPGHTAYALEPYVGTTNNYGNIYYTKNQLLGFIRLAAQNGLALHNHCCGDASVRLALDAYEAAAAEGIKLDPRFSIEHCDFSNIADVPRFTKLNVSANMQPDFLAPSATWDTNPYVQVLTPNCALGLWRAKSFIDAGSNIGFGTDYNASNLNPMVQIYRAMERVTDDGKPKGGYTPTEKVTVKEAIHCYTINSAKCVGMSDKIGTLEPGKYADIIVLDKNILNCSPQKLRDTKVIMTMLGGKIVYEKQ